MEQDAEKKRFCRKCLTRDMIGKEAYFRSLYAYIANLDEDVKAEAILSEKRLAVCRECDLLIDGLCRSCGCYVELRAAVKNGSCPWNKW